MLEGVSTQAVTAGNQAARDGQKLDQDLNKFLTLLVTQLQHQDPLDPLDAHEFTAQLVQFASVEQQIYQNNHLEDLLHAYQSAQSAATVAYIGTTVEANSDRLALQDGQARMSYTLAEPAASTSLVVKDDRGRVVYRTEGETTAGRHAFAWDGRDADGNRLPDGSYGFAAVAKGRDGGAIKTGSTVIGRIEAASFADGKVALSMGDLDISLDDVLAVHATRQSEPLAAALTH
jgi:flagellar basal-body rod modification protein FlgD